MYNVNILLNVDVLHVWQLQRSLGAAGEEAGHLRGQLAEVRHTAGAATVELEQAKRELDRIKEVCMHKVVRGCCFLLSL